MPKGDGNRKSIEQHRKDGTLRADRHSPYASPRGRALQLDRNPPNVWGWPGIQEIAFLLGLSLPTIRKRITAGRIPPPAMTIDRGRQIWEPTSFYQWLDAGCPPYEEADE